MSKGVVYIVQAGGDELVKFGGYSSEDENLHEQIFGQIEDTFKCKLTRTFVSPKTVWAFEITEALFRKFMEHRTPDKWHNIDFDVAVEAVKMLDEFLKNCSLRPVSQYGDAGDIAAIHTLESMGYTYKGGELWKPPLRGPLDFNLLDKQKREIIELKARLYDLMDKEVN
jgi:hypothetical protein